MSKYRIWNDEVTLPTISELEQIRTELITIKPFEPEVDNYVFLHGVAIVKFKEKMYCSWAHNQVQENSDDEEVNFSYSNDNGKTWSKFFKGNLAPEAGIAVSHGSFLEHDGNLYFFAPQFKGQLGAEMMRMGAYVLDENTQQFSYLGVVLNERFWPMCEPVLMENGNYLMAGIYVDNDFDSPHNAAAVAISHGSDILHWNMIKIEKEEHVKVWGECSVVVDGNYCKMYCRDRSEKLCALYAESLDYGNTWSKMDESNLPMTDSKPYAGVLSNGRNYLICSCAADIKKRNPLTIALTEKGENEFSKIYCIHSNKCLSYPYAIEACGKLYVAFSSNTDGANRNSAKLAIIDIEDLQ